MKRTWKRIGSLLLAVAMVLTLLPAVAFAAADITDSGTLKTALENTTSDTITIKNDITLTEAVAVGANHTLKIADGKSLTISGDGAVNIGPNTLNVQSVSDGFGFVTVNNSTVHGFYSDTPGGALNLGGLGNVFVNLENTGSGGIQVKTVNINEGAQVDVNSATGEKLIDLPDSSYALNVNSGGGLSIVDFKNTGIYNGGTLHLNAGGKGWFDVHPGQGANHAIDNIGLLKYTSGTTALEAGAAIWLAQGSQVEGMGFGWFNDRGQVFTSNSLVTVGAANTEPSTAGLTEGLYCYDSGVFRKPPAVTGSVTGTMDIGGQTGVDLSTNAGNLASSGWNWNAATATLTLGSAYGGNGIYFNTADAVKLTLASNVTISTTGIDYGIKSGGNLTIDTGSYTLNVTEAHSTYPAQAIRTAGALTISGSGSMSATHSGAFNGDVIYAIQGVTVTDSVHVTASATNNGSGLSSGSAGNIVITGSSKVTAAAKGGASSGLYATNGTITISGNAEVTASSADNWAIQSRGNLTISGSAKVNPSAISNSDIYSNGNITINTTGTVNTIAPSGASNGAITALGEIILQNGTVTATNTAENGNGIQAKSGIGISGGTVTATAKGTGYVLKTIDEGASVSISGGVVTLVNIDTPANMISAPGGLTQTGGTLSMNGQTATPSETITYPGVSLQYVTIGFGGYSNAVAPSDGANGNRVTVNDTSGTTDPDFVFGGYNTTGASTGNTVTLNANATINSGVFGGFATKGGNATGNTVIVNSGAVVNSVIYGSWTEDAGSSSGNAVIVNNGAVVNWGVYGGFLATDTGVTADNNTVTLHSGVTVARDVYGGSRFGLLPIGLGNTLKLIGSGQGVGENLGGFQILDIALPAAADGSTVLTVGEQADISGVTVKLAFDAAPSLAAGNKITLIDAGAGTLTGAPTNSTATASGYTFGIAVEGNKLIATVTGVPGGGDGGGGGGSSVGTPPAETTTSGNTATATTTATATVDSSGTATAAVTPAQLSEAITKAAEAAAQQGGGAAAIVEIKVTAPADAKTVETSIPKEAMKLVADGKTAALTVSTPVASLSFDAAALSTIAGEAAGDVKVTASKADVSSLSAETQQLIGDRPVFNFSVTSGGQTISQFGGSVSVSVPYTPKAGEDLDAIVIYYINADGKAEIVSNCSYDPATGTISFKTSHFSKYAVGYNKVTFKDVAEGAWYSKAVSFIAARGVTAGTGNGNYSPEAELTRGEFIVMVMRAYGIAPDTATTENFADAGNAYYTGYLAAAKRLGISGGVGGNLFAPGKEITRQEMFTLLYNALNAIGQLPEGNTGKSLSAFSDAGQIASWAKDAMTLLVKTGTVGGSKGKLTPEETTTRAQMAQVLCNLISK